MVSEQIEVTGLFWCDYCQDSYDVRHYDENHRHLKGAAYGPTGEDLEYIETLERMALRMYHGLMNRGAWECPVCVDMGKAHADDCLIPSLLSKYGSG